LNAQCAVCNPQDMDANERRVAAGTWLREQRTQRGFKTAGEFARALEVDPSRVSAYENDRSLVPDDRAEQIAELFEMDIIEVRRNLGLWVPPSDSKEASTPRRTGPTADLLRRMDDDPELAHMIAEIFRRASRTAPSSNSSRDDRPATGS
jgi:transcriptional regulator with XRE-family HTH domain